MWDSSTLPHRPFILYWSEGDQTDLFVRILIFSNTKKICTDSLVKIPQGGDLHIQLVSPTNGGNMRI